MELNESEKKDLRIILESIFGIHDVADWQMNMQVLEVTAKMLSGAQGCSEALSATPRPGLVDKAYFRRQLRNTARRMAKGGVDIYSICATTGTRIKWKSELARAAMGL